MKAHADITASAPHSAGTSGLRASGAVTAAPAAETPTEVTPEAVAVIEACGVKKHYGPVHAVNGVDLRIGRGEMFGLIGHNGAGKSTLFKMMLGLTPLSAGEIRIDGQNITGSHFRSVRRKVGYLPENVVLYDNLTGLETLHFFARLKRSPLGDCEAVLEQVGLTHAARRRVREYSKGMRQRLGFAQTLLGQPQILFLDEPTTGLDPEAIREFYVILRGLREAGVTMIITSHILAEIQERVDRLAIMAAGKVQATGTVQGLREQMSLPLTIEASLTVGDAHAAELLGAALAHLPIDTLTSRDHHCVIKCPRELKLQVLAALMSLGDRLRDLQVREASLEDVFFGFSD